MLVFVGTLPILLKLGSNLRKEAEYIGQPSRLVHLPDVSDGADFEGTKSDLA